MTVRGGGSSAPGRGVVVCAGGESDGRLAEHARNRNPARGFGDLVAPAIPAGGRGRSCRARFTAAEYRTGGNGAAAVAPRMVCSAKWWCSRQRRWRCNHDRN